MTLDQLKELMAAGDMSHCINTFETHILIKNIYEAFKQYDPLCHEVKSPEKRPDKIIKDEDGNPTGVVKVARLPIPVQKKIVVTAAAFLGTPALESTPANDKEKDLLKIVTKICKANKLDYKFRTIAKKTMSERHCAELWYTQDVDGAYWDGFPIDTKFKLTVQLLAYSLGDKLYPVFDGYGNMIAFGREYQVMGDSGAKIQHFDVYTATEFYFSKKETNSWLFSDGAEYTAGVKAITNVMGKIPVVYYCQPAVEWQDVQDLIDRLEKKISNHADTNDYFDSPIIVATGEVQGFAKKGESGKLLEVKNDAKVEYLTWDNAPASTKMEIENLLKFIYTFTHTPDISFESMKGLPAFSGVALKMMFLDAHLKASDKEEIFGEGVQRRLNYLKSAIAIMDPSFKAALPLEIEPKFKYFLPENVLEQVQVLTQAVTGGILSRETAVRLNPLVNDADAELDAIAGEKEPAPVIEEDPNAYPNKAPAPAPTPTPAK